ncbi:carbonic anhydrase [Nitrospina gracilis]|uniref:carbonic anhydrase n=1 Tax=Nitrospina gracilis TaxID=35801 RepID=UPI001F31D62D|nr:carbonic anhydrase [Nitrospina gracilis]MCF8721258.1 carbonic anhydrase [Nitrospina gracilis Nb-211]
MTTQILEELIQGNQRFIKGATLHPHQDPIYRKQCAKGRPAPIAVLACADSRVSPEIIFDQGLGDLFVLRVAGNIAAAMVLASLEYAVEQLGTQLIIVLGHSNCGAVTAAVSGTQVPGHIGNLVEFIQPSVKKCTNNGHPPEVIEVVRENVLQTVNNIREADPILSKLIAEDRLEIMGAIYHLESGKIELL